MSHLERRPPRPTPGARPRAIAVFLLLAMSATLASAAPLSAAWEFVPTPVPARGPGGVFGVDALSASDAWAVGCVFTTAELNGIVYDVTESLALHWDGRTWSIVPSPDPSAVPQQNLVVAVDAIAHDDVWAVGSNNNNAGNWGPVAQTLAMHWDGGQWTVVPSPLIEGGSTFSALSARSTNDVWAVGLRMVGSPGPAEAPLTAHWDGSQWNEVPAPFVGDRINRLQGVSARATNDAWAVGYWRSTTTTFHILIEHWNGSAWSVSSAADPGNNDELLAVTAVSANDAWAVGDRNDPAEGSQPLIMHWNGTKWSTYPLPVFPGEFNRLNSVKALSATDIWAAGAFATVAGGSSEALLMHWDGNSWSTVALGATGGTAEYLDGIGTGPGGEVWAVGTFQADGRMVPLTEHLGPIAPLPVGVPGTDPGRAGAGVLLAMGVAPNPTREATSVSLVLAHATPIRAEVFDARGARVRLLDERVAPAGVVVQEWNGRDDSGNEVPPAVYFIRVSAESESRSVRVVLRP